LIMPDMTGFELLERLKSREETKNIPVIFNTSASLSDEERSRLAPGTAAILSKSGGTAEEVSATIRDALILAGLKLTLAGIEE
jgi:CheY-like chemotaxis protein